MFTKEARLGAALDGKLPKYVMTMLVNLNEKGNIYGADKNENTPEINNGDVLFFLGEDTRAKGCAKAAIELLKNAGVEFSVLKDEPNSGYSMEFLISAAAETKAVMENCAKVLNNYKKVVCYDPADAKVMNREYKEWGIELKAEVVTFTSFIAELIKNGKLQPKKQNLAFTPQDTPILARDLEETAPVRDILSACGEIREMLLNREHTMLAGNLIMNEYMPEVMKMVAENRWINAKNVNADILVTSSPAEYMILNSVKPEGVDLITIEEAVLRCL